MALRDLLEGLRGRDPAAIREVVDQQARRIYRAARALGFSPSDAEDLAQEVFVTFLEALAKAARTLSASRDAEPRKEFEATLSESLHQKPSS